MGTRKITIEVPRNDEVLHVAILERVICTIKSTKEEYNRGAETCILSGEFTEDEVEEMKEIPNIYLVSQVKSGAKNCYQCEFRI